MKKINLSTPEDTTEINFYQSKLMIKINLASYTHKQLIIYKPENSTKTTQNREEERRKKKEEKGLKFSLATFGRSPSVEIAVSTFSMREGFSASPLSNSHPALALGKESAESDSIIPSGNSVSRPLMTKFPFSNITMITSKQNQHVLDFVEFQRRQEYMSAKEYKGRVSTDPKPKGHLVFKMIAPQMWLKTITDKKELENEALSDYESSFQQLGYKASTRKDWWVKVVKTSTIKGNGPKMPMGGYWLSSDVTNPCVIEQQKIERHDRVAFGHQKTAMSAVDAIESDHESDSEKTDSPLQGMKDHTVFKPTRNIDPVNEGDCLWSDGLGIVSAEAKAEASAYWKQHAGGIFRGKRTSTYWKKQVDLENITDCKNKQFRKCVRKFSGKCINCEALN